jgi:hypothetical protein
LKISDTVFGPALATGLPSDCFVRSSRAKSGDCRTVACALSLSAWSGLGGAMALGRALKLAARGELDGFGCVGAQWPIAF